MSTPSRSAGEPTDQQATGAVSEPGDGQLLDGTGTAGNQAESTRAIPSVPIQRVVLPGVLHHY
jgi:hypothetical protein